MQSLDIKTLKKIVRSIASTRPDEIACDDCYEELDRFVEMHHEGQDPTTLMPLVQDHLNRCDCCHEEYEALLRALQEMGASSGEDTPT